MNTQRKALFISISSFILFFILAVLVEFDLTTGFDRAMNYFYTSYESSLLFFLSITMHYLFDTITVLVVSTALSIYLLTKKRHVEAYMMLTGISLDILIVYTFKNLIERPRSIFNLLIDHGFSFPSGHTAAAMVFMGLFAAILFARYRQESIRRKISIAFGILVAFVGFSRVYLGVHYFTDIFASFLLGTGIVFLTLYIFKRSHLMLNNEKKN